MKKVVLFVRVPEQLKLQLEAMAKAQGRTLNTEVVERLVASFGGYRR